MKNFTIEELAFSRPGMYFGIPNYMTDEIKTNIQMFIENLLDPIADAWTVYCGKENIECPKLCIETGYISNELNKLIYFDDNSSHLKGFAADLYPSNKDTKSFSKFILDFAQNSGVPFDEIYSTYPRPVCKVNKVVYNSSLDASVTVDSSSDYDKMNIYNYNQQYLNMLQTRLIHVGLFSPNHTQRHQIYGVYVN